TSNPGNGKGRAEAKIDSIWKPGDQENKLKSGKQGSRNDPKTNRIPGQAPAIPFLNSWPPLQFDFEMVQKSADLRLFLLSCVRSAIAFLVPGFQITFRFPNFPLQFDF